ncbi:hypothetical protein [Noviherbaspirillum aerium]|uniref:hypothetical protein n=1 Tax=Noviherbaspirillum aerium TaxID=2588497 RepID=UPI00124D22A3|nr:hypothetical protein [Noviherbaspirillum aerium]
MSMLKTKAKAMLAMAAILCGCGQQRGGGDSYFPLTVGSSWTYAVSSEIDGRSQRDMHVISVISEHMEGGKPVAIRRSETAGNIGVEYALRSAPGAIERIAQRSDLEEQATPDEPPRTVLPLPLKAGASWRSSTTAYFILRKSEYPRELKYSQKVLMTYTVEAVEETVTVPAGTFAHCARIAGLAHLTLYTDPVAGFRKVPLVTSEWYCRGIGLVKLERTEDVSTAFFSGGSMRMELSEYTLR